MFILKDKIGFLAFSYYLIITILAIVLGIVLVLTIQPGINLYNSNDASTEPGPGKKIKLCIDIIVTFKSNELLFHLKFFIL